MRYSIECSIFKETGNLENISQSGRPFLSVDRVHFIRSVLEVLVANTSTVSSSGRESQRIRFITELFIRQKLNLRGVLNLYSPKI